MSNVRRLGALGLALALAPIVSMPGLAQEASPCADGAGTLISNWEAEGLPGTKGRMTRSTMECLGDGRIRHVVEVSKDGESWRVLFESVYGPAAEPAMASAPAAAAPAPSSAQVASSAPAPSTAAPADPPAAATQSSPPAPAPAPDVAAGEKPTSQHQASRQANVEGSEVQAVSRELGREEIPEEEAPELVMASPLVLELKPGEVDEYPEGTAWSTDETAGFIVGQVILKKVTIGRKIKGGKIHLIVGAQLYTKKRQRSVDVLFEAMLDGEVIASEQLRKVRIGLNIPRHGKDGMLVNTLLELPSDDFDRLFADGAERKMRVTLTVPSA